MKVREGQGYIRTSDATLINPPPSASSLFPSSQVFHDSQLTRSRPHVTLAADQENNHVSNTYQSSHTTAARIDSFPSASKSYSYRTSLPDGPMIFLDDHEGGSAAKTKNGMTVRRTPSREPKMTLRIPKVIERIQVNVVPSRDQVIPRAFERQDVFHRYLLLLYRTLCQIDADTQVGISRDVRRTSGLIALNSEVECKRHVDPLGGDTKNSA